MGEEFDSEKFQRGIMKQEARKSEDAMALTCTSRDAFKFFLDNGHFLQKFIDGRSFTGIIGFDSEVFGENKFIEAEFTALIDDKGEYVLDTATFYARDMKYSSPTYRVANIVNFSVMHEDKADVKMYASHEPMHLAFSLMIAMDELSEDQGTQ